MFTEINPTLNRGRQTEYCCVCPGVFTRKT
jgi:hypothetical protein